MQENGNGQAAESSEEVEFFVDLTGSGGPGTGPRFPGWLYIFFISYDPLRSTETSARIYSSNENSLKVVSYCPISIIFF